MKCENGKSKNKKTKQSLKKISKKICELSVKVLEFYCIYLVIYLFSLLNTFNLYIFVYKTLCREYFEGQFRRNPRRTNDILYQRFGKNLYIVYFLCVLHGFLIWGLVFESFWLKPRVLWDFLKIKIFVISGHWFSKVFFLLRALIMASCHYIKRADSHYSG